MSNFFLINYSSFIEKDFAIKLNNSLKANQPPVSLQLDKRYLNPMQNWDERIAKVILEYDSIEDKSVYILKLKRTYTYKKPIIPNLMQTDPKVCVKKTKNEIRHYVI